MFTEISLCDEVLVCLLLIVEDEGSGWVLTERSTCVLEERSTCVLFGDTLSIEPDSLLVALLSLLFTGLLVFTDEDLREFPPDSSDERRVELIVDVLSERVLAYRASPSLLDCGLEYVSL